MVANRTLKVHLLGDYRVVVGAVPIPAEAWRSRRAAALLKLLALAPGHALTRDEVLEALWPALPPPAATNNLRVTAHALRGILRASPGVSIEPLRYRGDRLALQLDGPVVTDVAAFEAAAAAARRTRNIDNLESALALYGGDLLPEDRYEDWASARREALRDTFLALLADLARLREEGGDPTAATAALERLSTADPVREETHVALMRLYARMGQRSLALRQWARLEAALREELDAEPAPESRRLHLEILAGRLTPPGVSRPAEPLPVEVAPRHNLPAALTSFIGRASERATLAALLVDGGSGSRLVTLTGSGGVGKTRLALAVATEIAAGGAFRDSVWLVELAGAAAPSLVAVVAAALGVRDGPGRPPLKALVDALRDRETLLVLDNCEHLVESCAALCATLLIAAPGLRILATSRALLGVPGERSWPVPPLSLPPTEQTETPEGLAGSEAVRLFVDRARWRRPNFAVTAANAAAIGAICRRLEGLPLALELAAARLGLLPVGELAMRLDDSLGLLASGPRAAPARQRTLRATLDWSHDLLAEPERALLRRLAAFAGGWTLDAAEVVCGVTFAGLQAVPAHAALAALHDQSLVWTEEGDAGPRYRLLEPVRQYAAERLAASGEEPTVRARHAAHFLHLAEAAAPHLRGPEAGQWFARLEAEHDNLRAALGWSVVGSAETALRLVWALKHFWEARGHLDEGRRWMAAALRSTTGLAISLRAWVLSAAAWLATDQGDFAAAHELHHEALVLHRAHDDRGGVASSLNNLGRVAYWQGDLAGSRALLEESAALYRALGDPAGVASSRHNLGRVALKQGDYAEAWALHHEYLAHKRMRGDQLSVADALNALGNVARMRGELATARALHDEALALTRALGCEAGIARSLYGLGELARHEGDAAQARSLLGEALAGFQSHGQRGDVAIVLGALAALTPQGHDAAPRAVRRSSTSAWEPAEARALPAASSAHPPMCRPDLSLRECEIAALAAEGRTNSQIAADLGLSIRTVDTHVRNILRKLGIASRADIAVRLGGAATPDAVHAEAPEAPPGEGPATYA
jgi:predicted ATPase/DNA-binding SARP family transcriptional activator/DNA-binding CsgD family transcriptional regulator